MSNTQQLKLGPVKDLAVLRADFNESGSVTIELKAFPEVEGDSALSREPKEVRYREPNVWHEDLREAVRSLRPHFAFLSGLMGPLTDLPMSDWDNLSEGWWEKFCDDIRISGIVWVGADRMKVKVLGGVSLRDGYESINTPNIDLDNSNYHGLADLTRALKVVEKELVEYLHGKYAGVQLNLFDQEQPESGSKMNGHEQPLLLLPGKELKTAGEVIAEAEVLPEPDPEQIESVREEGREAKKRGIKKSHCPYTIGWMMQAWGEGWSGKNKGGNRGKGK